jgi:hypothetical protein
LGEWKYGELGGDVPGVEGGDDEIILAFDERMDDAADNAGEPKVDVAGDRIMGEVGSTGAKWISPGGRASPWLDSGKGLFSTLAWRAGFEFDGSEFCLLHSDNGLLSAVAKRLDLEGSVLLLLNDSDGLFSSMVVACWKNSAANVMLLLNSGLGTSSISNVKAPSISIGLASSCSASSFGMGGSDFRGWWGVR